MILQRRKALHCISSFGENSHLGLFLKVQRDRNGNISIGKDTSIGSYSWLAAMPLTNAPECHLIFGDGCQIGEYNHIYATGSIVFEDNVLTANFVYISDNLHEYEDIYTPIWKQPIKQLSPMRIGSGCWIGEHVSIIGANIGRNSVIGANSVVTHDIPDYCVAVGAPAIIIKRFDFQSNQWRRTDRNGIFLP